MKRTLSILLALLIVLFVFAGCAKEPEVPEPTPSPTPEATAAPTPAPTPTPTPEPTVNPVPEDASPVTGMRGITTTYKPIIVQIENEYDARPQAGIQYADVVYETLIEGWDTRFTCVFNDILYAEGNQEVLEVGPVRSSRYYSQWIQGEWDALYVHMGGAETPGVESNIWGASGEHIKQRINGAGQNAENANLIYRRAGTGKATEHTAYTDLMADLTVYSYDPTPRQPFRYYPLESYSDAAEVEKVELKWWYYKADVLGFVEYRYDKEKDKFIRYMIDHEFIAEETGEALEVQNIIIQYTENSDFPNEGGRKKIELFGSGDAEFFIHGKHMSGTWEREDSSSHTTYYLGDGEEVTLAPGNTWIEVYPKDSRVGVTYADGTEYIVNGE